jgi:hypothetical protein
MPFAPSSPVTGGPQTGLTSPTYTLVADTAPAAHGKQYYVSALGGTQTGVEVNSLSNPFTTTFFKVAAPKALPPVNASGGLSSVPKNVFKWNVRKGLEVVSGQPRQVGLFELSMSLPAGADIQDPESVRAALSLLFGIAWAESSNIGTTLITNGL